MSAVQRIAKNSAVLLTAQVLSAVLGFLFMIYTARYLGAAGFGIITFALAFTQLFGFVTNIGLVPLTVRQVARDKSLAPKYLANISLMKVILAGATFGLIALVINLMGYPQQTIHVVYLVGLSVILTALTKIAYSIFQAFEKMEYVSLGQIMNAALLLVGLVFALKYGFSVVGFAYLYVFASGTVLLYSIGVLGWRFLFSSVWSGTKMKIDLGFWIPTLKQALPFGITAISISLLHNFDTLMLSAMVADSNQVVGWYNAAYRLVYFLQFTRVALSTAVFPVLSQAYVTSKESLVLFCERFFKYSLMLALPIGVGGTILAAKFIAVVYGIEYFKSVIALQILIWSAVIMYANFAVGLFQATDRQVTVTKIVLFAAALNILLNLLLIPRFSYTGAAAATVACNVVSLSILLRIFSKTEYTFSVSFALKNLARILIASAIMGCFVWYCQNIHLAVLVILSALLYVVLLFLMRTFDKTDFRIFTSLLRGVAVLPNLDIRSTGE